MTSGVKYIDPRYESFHLPHKERMEAYQQVRKDAKLKKEDARRVYLAQKEELLKKKEELLASGTKPSLVRAMLKPAMENNKKRYHSMIEEAKRDISDSHYLIAPFRFFYVPVHVDGNILLKPQGHVLLSVLIVALLFIASQFFLEFEKARFNFDNIGMIFSQMFGPQTSGMTNLDTWGKWFGYMGNTAIPLIWQTFEMMFVATSIGAIIAIPFMILCSVNIVNNKAVNFIFRFFLNVLRTIPTAVLGIIGVAFFNIGNTAGVFAMILFTAGILIKIMYEYIETVDMHPYEAILSTGSTKPKAFVVSIFPQILPVFLANIIYTFEINIRASVILGYVNAGGIGKEISESMDYFQYNKVGAILLPLLVLVLVLQLFSNYLKRRTQ